MANNITLNTSNILNLNTGNNRFEYVFPQEVEFTEGSTVALSHLNVFLSWYNITSTYNNNKLTYLFWDNNGVLQPFDIVFEDGFYNTTTLYEYIQSKLVANGHYLEYLVPGPGGEIQVLYPISIRPNETYYKLGFVFASIGENMDFGGGVVSYDTIFKVPTTWKPPAVIDTMALQMSAFGCMNEILGFKQGELVAPQTINATKFEFYNVLSSTIPQLMPSSSYIINCSLCNNEMSTNRMSLSTFTIPNGTGFGDLIDSSSTPIYNLIQPGKYKRFFVEIIDQNFRRLDILDSNILINLSIIKNI